MPPAASSSRLPRLRRALRRRRRTLAALLGLAVAAMLAPALVPDRPTAPVLVAAREIAPGTRLAPDDLEIREVPAELAPDGALAEDTLAVGRRTRVPLLSGQPVSPASLQGRDETSLSPGSDVIAVPVDAALVPYLSPGVPVRLLISVPDASRTRVVDAIVQAGAGRPGGAPLPPTTAGGSAETVLVAVDPRESADIAHATREAWVVVALSG